MFVERKLALATLNRGIKWLKNLKQITDYDCHNAVNWTLGCFVICEQLARTRFKDWVSSEARLKLLRYPRESVLTREGRVEIMELLLLTRSLLRSRPKRKIYVGPLPVEF